MDLRLRGRLRLTGVWTAGGVEIISLLDRSWQEAPVLLTDCHRSVGRAGENYVNIYRRGECKLARDTQQRQRVTRGSSSAPPVAGTVRSVIIAGSLPLITAGRATLPVLKLFPFTEPSKHNTSYSDSISCHHHPTDGSLTPLNRTNSDI